MRSTNSNASDAQLEDDLTFGIFTISHIGFISHLKSLTFNLKYNIRKLYYIPLILVILSLEDSYAGKSEIKCN